MVKKTRQFQGLTKAFNSDENGDVREPCARKRTKSGYFSIDKLNFATVGAGISDFALRRAANINCQLKLMR